MIESNSIEGSYHVLTKEECAKGGRGTAVKRSKIGENYMNLLDFLTDEERANINGNYGKVLYFMIETNPIEGSHHVLTAEESAKGGRANGGDNIVQIDKNSLLIITVPSTAVALSKSGNNKQISCGHPDRTNAKLRVEKTLKQYGLERYYSAFLRDFAAKIKGSKHYKALSADQLKETNFQCSVCDIYFSSKSCLSRHLTSGSHSKMLALFI